MWRDEEVADGGGGREGGGRMRMGSLNAIMFSCGTVTFYLTGVDVRRWLAVPTEEQPVPFPFANFPRTCPSLIGTLA